MKQQSKIKEGNIEQSRFFLEKKGLKNFFLKIAEKNTFVLHIITIRN